MLRLLILAATLACFPALAAEDLLRSTIDLNEAGALAQLEQSNPAHFERIQQILAGLREQPQRAEGDWLQVQFNARDVDLSRFLLKTSNPPKQMLQFTLDDVRYRMNLVRSDLSASFMPAR
ncbi:MAG TPA: hypothetical protein VJQ52_10855 [Steroidobacteraceae bacterium]|nr:hypothetical protein [Steroidobacteraceae bacterium]